MSKELKDYFKKEKNFESKLEGYNKSTSKPTLKKKGLASKILKKVIQGSLIASTSLFVFRETKFVLNTTKGDYSPNESIEAVIQQFDLDDTVGITSLKGEFYRRAMHNGNKPIYFHIKDNYSDGQKKIIKNVLAEYQNMFESIDPRYRFQEVDYSTWLLNSILGDTTLVFDNKLKHEPAYGRYNGLTSFFNKERVPHNTIVSNDSLINNDGRDAGLLFEHVMIHEVAHFFGLSDMYLNSRTADYYNSFMSAESISLEMGMLYPNDYSMLVAMYYNVLDKDNNIVEDKVDYASSLVSDYKTKFFEKMYNISDTALDGNIRQDIDSKDVSGKDFSLNRIVFENDKVVSVEHGFKIINDKQFVFTIYEDKKVVYEYVGNYEKINNMIVFDKVVSPKGSFANLLSTKRTEREVVDMYVLFKENNQYKFLHSQSPGNVKAYNAFVYEREFEKTKNK